MENSKTEKLLREILFYNHLLENYDKNKNITNHSESEKRKTHLNEKKQELHKHKLQYQPSAVFNETNKYIFKKNGNTELHTGGNKLMKFYNKDIPSGKKSCSPNLFLNQKNEIRNSEIRLNSNISSSKYFSGHMKQFSSVSRNSMVKNNKYAKVFATKEINCNAGNILKRKAIFKKEPYCGVAAAKDINDVKNFQNVSVTRVFKTHSNIANAMHDKPLNMKQEMQNKVFIAKQQKNIKDFNTEVPIFKNGIMNKATNSTKNYQNTVQKFQVSKNGKYLISSKLCKSSSTKSLDKNLIETKSLQNTSQCVKSLQKNLSSNVTTNQNAKMSVNLKSLPLSSKSNISVTPLKLTSNKKIALKLTPKRKFIASKYKVINKNVFSTDKRKMLSNSKPNESTNLQNSCKINQSFSKYKAVISKYKIVNKNLRKSFTPKHHTSLHQVNDRRCQKVRKVYKLVNNSIKAEDKSFPKLQEGSCQKLKSTTKIKSMHKIINVKPVSKVCDPTKISKPNFNYIPSTKSHILKSKYKVVNKFSASAQNNFECKKKLHVLSRSHFINVAQVRQRSPLNRSVLLRRLYKSKSAIINKNSSPINQTAKMIKTKYFSLNKQRPYHKHLSMLTPKFKKSHQSRKLHFTKQKHFQRFHTMHPNLRKYSRFCHVSTPNVNRYSKVNSVHRRNSLGKRRSYPGKTSNTVWKKMVQKSPKLSSPIVLTLASRVLHRSINQAVSTCVKKKTKIVNTYCMFYNRFGRCNKGVKCTFIHDPSKIAVCTRFLRGTCKKDGCPFSHEVCPGKMALCSYFQLGSCNNDSCPYRHEMLSPNSELCKEFVQGYCSVGKKCKKAHILICPHYVNGNCEKGKKCIFPHPPQKMKKNNTQQLEDHEYKELLFEKMSRYFQTFTEEFASNSSSERSENCQIEVVIPPRTHNLPEQPSFIPLSGECYFHEQFSGNDEKI